VSGFAGCTWANGAVHVCVCVNVDLHRVYRFPSPGDQDGAGGNAAL